MGAATPGDLARLDEAIDAVGLALDEAVAAGVPSGHLRVVLRAAQDQRSALATPPAPEAVDEEPWLPMPVERAIERLDRSTAADTISEHRHAVITLQNFARARLAATPPAPKGEAEREGRRLQGLVQRWHAGEIVALELAQGVGAVAHRLADEPPAPAGPQAEDGIEDGQP